jgi:hypothetical protein
MKLFKALYNVLDALSHLTKVLVLVTILGSLGACSSTSNYKPAAQDTTGWLSGILDR